LISRCDSAAMVSKTSELLPEPDTPVKTVRRRFGSSRLTSFRLLARAPVTRIRSWLSAAGRLGGRVSVKVMRESYEGLPEDGFSKPADVVSRAIAAATPAANIGRIASIWKQFGAMNGSWPWR
jgi:hypothetical protein